jgi:hypothetical protein
MRASLGSFHSLALDGWLGRRTSMRSWIATGLTLVGIGGSLLLSGVAFAEEESRYCPEARKSEAQDRKNSMQCGMRPDPRGCTTTVDGRVYSGYAVSCESPLTGIYQGLCRDGVTDHDPLDFECWSELSL